MRYPRLRGHDLQEDPLISAGVQLTEAEENCPD